MATTATSRRCWFQISLKTLLLLGTLTSATFGWLGWKFRQAKRQREAVYAISRLAGCAAITDSDGYPPGPLWLRQWMEDDYFFANVTTVGWSGPQVNDDTIAYLEALPELAVLTLDRTDVTDAGLVHLRKLKKLTELRISRSPITDVGLVHLRELKELQYLQIEGTPVTKQGCETLQNFLPHLEIDSDVYWAEEVR